MTQTSDLYTILGVSPECEDFVIQAAYRALMRRYHPDTNTDPASAKKAQDINAAYSVLSDPVKRARYDATRRTKFTHGQSTRNGKPQGGPDPEPQPPPTDNSDVVHFEEGRGGLAALAFLVVLGIAAIIVYAAVVNYDNSADELAAQADALSTETMNVDESIGLNEVGNEVMPAKLSEIPQPKVAYLTIEAAANRFARLLLKGGMIDARAYSQDCHKRVGESPSWEGADSCAAFDLAAAFIDQQLCSDKTCVPNGYFKFQQQNIDDLYESAGAASYSVAGRVNQIKSAVEPAAEEAVQSAVARFETEKAERAAKAVREAARPTTDPFANAHDPTYVDENGVTRKD